MNWLYVVGLVIIVFLSCWSNGEEIQTGDNIHSLHSIFPEDKEHGVSDVEWDYFLLSMEWPQSACEVVNGSHQHHKCVISSSVKGWTLHGLWPSSSDGQQPFYCHEWEFDFSKIQDLVHDLLKYWPNLYIDTPETNLWKHEYQKHGTCAASVPGFEEEHEYFQRTLELRNKFDPFQVLVDSNITPRGDGYQYSDITDALQNGFNKTTCAQCRYVHGVGQVLSALDVCMTKQLDLIDCADCSSPCQDDEPVYYHPLHY